MSDIIRSLAKIFSGGPQPQMNRRDFLRSVGGAVASAAVPKLPGVEAVPVAAATPEFVTDPKMLHGFRDGLSSFGDLSQYWVNADYPEMEGLSHAAAASLIRRMGLEKAGRAAIPLTEALPGQVGHYAWNRYSQQWHPVVALPGDRPNVTKIRYLEPGSAIPKDALGRDYWADKFGPYEGFRESTEFFDSPEEFGKSLMEDWRLHKLSDMRETGPDKRDIAQDPELRERYVQQAQRMGVAPGGRFEQQAPLDLAPRSPRRGEFELPLDPSVPPQDPPVTRQNYRRYLAPALLAPALTEPSETDRR